MAQQTAMQLMLWYLKNEGLEQSGAYYKAKHLLELEKEQQFKFFIAGQLSMEEGGKDFEQYYKKTYGKV